MNECPIKEWIILKKAKDLLENGYKISFYNLILNQIKDYLYQQLSIGQQLITDIASITESIIIALENALNIAASPKQWACFILNEQISIAEVSLTREINLINEIVSRLDGMQRRLKVDRKNYGKMSRALHKWLQSSYRDLKDCLISDDIFAFEQRFKSSYSKMQIIKIMLEFKQRRSNIDALLGNVKREFGDIIENKGDPIRKIDHNAAMKAIIDDQKKDVIDAVNFIDNWIFFLNNYIYILKNYMGCDLGVFIKPFTDNLEIILKNAIETPIWEWSIKSLTNEIDWTGCIREISLKTLIPDMSSATVVGNQHTYVGSLIIIGELLLMMGDIEESSAVWKNVGNDLKEKAGELMGDEIFTQIRKDDGFTDVGKNDKDKDLVEGNYDKLKQLFKTNNILLDYKLTEGTLLSNALTSQAGADFLNALTIAMEEIESLNGGTIESIIYGKNLYQSDIISAFMEAANVKGISSVIELGSRVAIGTLNYNSLQKHIEYFEARRVILIEYRRIIKKIPEYRNENINQLIKVLTDFGFTTLVDNLRKGVSLFDQTPLSSAVGLERESIRMLSALSDCIGLTKTPGDLKAINKMIGELNTEIHKTKKLNIEKGINGILRTLGLNFDWIKRMLSKSYESDDILVEIEYVKGLMEDVG